MKTTYSNVFFSIYWYIDADNGISIVDMWLKCKQNTLAPQKPITKPWLKENKLNQFRIE